MMSDVVACKNITKVYQQGTLDVKALDDVTISVKSREFVSLYGPSGSGKTTLLNLIGTLDRPTSGEISLDCERVDSKSNSELAVLRLKKIGFVFQAYNLIPVLTAQENVEFVMQLQGVSRAERAELANNILNEVGLKGLGNRRPSELSGGQQQRVAVARAIVSKPSLVLADEPTANLDSTTATELLELMLRMNEQHGTTFIFSTHDPIVMKYAKRLVQLKDGKVVHDRENS
jgi:putative ABC transport system ATP-binding protein